MINIVPTHFNATRYNTALLVVKKTPNRKWIAIGFMYSCLGNKLPGNNQAVIKKGNVKALIRVGAGYLYKDAKCVISI